MKLGKKLILASASPRRKFLLMESGLEFEIYAPEVEETYPQEIEITQVASYLASKKAESAKQLVGQDAIILAADTTVILDQTILHKPLNRDKAIQMLLNLSGKTHLVITGVCIIDNNSKINIQEQTEVSFHHLNLKEIESYVDNFKPFDKAGSYGAQECLPDDFSNFHTEETNFLKEINKPDLIFKSKQINSNKKPLMAINKIKGSFFNVMGLPIHLVYDALMNFQ